MRQEITTLGSGLQYFDYRHSDGALVGLGSQVRVHYQVTLDLQSVGKGPWVDDSWKRESPVTFVIGAGQVIKGVDEGIVGMRVASERCLIIPPGLAFADRGVPDRIPPNTTLAFQLYVVMIV